ncbi:hypothetical protein HII31_12339 [Pseudocercospora fuligena]|uniref:RNAse P Rpr2/Rpp21 subunit domain-containing protein n=1 Tax=Pseudocercospora fuligena TaxID=685502 RepID=A0A8H6R700_9PEZI|nr:hypothetical protein HII31_12339 [Pseudocercospora fuligena]
MGKDKGKAHLHARVAYLQKAAAYIASQQIQQEGPNDTDSELKPSGRPRDDSTEIDLAISLEPENHSKKPDPRDSVEHNAKANDPDAQLLPIGGLAYHISSQTRQVALKSQIRLSSNFKQSSCKICNAVLVDDHTCKRTIENTSRGGQKTHANVLVVECIACGTKKRYPIGAKRQQRKKLRAIIGDGTSTDPTRPDA